jgi:Clostripain family
MAKKAPSTNAIWTVMVFMGADQLPPERDLADFAEDDLQEMELLPFDRDVLNIVVQMDRKDAAGGPARFFIGQKGREELKGADSVPPNQKSVGPEVLEQFISWTRKRYPADHYMLVLWGHAYKLAFNRDPDRPDGLSFSDLAAVVGRTNNGKKLDIVAFDSCNVGLVEAAFELRNAADYMIASQFTDPLPGWPYEVILRRIHDDESWLAGSDGPKDFGRAIVSQFVRRYIGDKNVTMTLMDLSRVDQIRQGVDELATQVALAINGDPRETAAVNQMLRQSQVPENQPSVDLATFCWHLANFSTNDRVRVAAAALGDRLLIPAEPFIVSHGRSGLAVAMLQGVSIMVPNVVNQSRCDVQNLRSDYRKLELSKRTLWGDLVFALAEAD